MRTENMHGTIGIPNWLLYLCQKSLFVSNLCFAFLRGHSNVVRKQRFKGSVCPTSSHYRMQLVQVERWQ